MEKADFIANYKCIFRIQRTTDNNLVATTEIINRSTNKVFRGVKTEINYSETNDNINDSKFSTTPVTWDLFIDKTKRSQLDFFAIQIPIDDFYPIGDDKELSAFYD